MSQVLKERAGFRVRLVDADYAEEPYDDGSTPLVRFEESAWFGGVKDQMQVENITSFRIPEKILVAMERFRDEEIGRFDRTTFERYLRIFHGTRSIVWYQSDAWHYVTFDTEAWRNEMGLTDEHLANHPDVEGDGFASLEEYRAWIDGEVYGYVVERRQRWLPVNEENEVISFLDNDEMVTWEEVDSCYGYYGSASAIEAAEDAFRHVLADQGVDPE